MDVHLRKLVEIFALWWDGKVRDLFYQSNDTVLLVLSTDTVFVDDDFLINPITENSLYSLFDVE